MRWATRSRLAAAASLAIVLSVNPAGSLQRGFFRSFASSSGDRAVSSSVIATWVSHPGETGRSTLDLLILWRGTPGWFMGGSGGIGGGSGSYGTATTFHEVWAGGHKLEFTIDPDARNLKILGESFSLADVNVLLIDQADSAAGPRIVRTLWVDPEYPAEPFRIELVIRRSSELLEFLRCDAQLRDALQQAMMAFICAQVRGQ